MATISDIMQDLICHLVLFGSGFGLDFTIIPFYEFRSVYWLLLYDSSVFNVHVDSFVGYTPLFGDPMFFNFPRNPFYILWLMLLIVILQPWWFKVYRQEDFRVMVY